MVKLNGKSKREIKKLNYKGAAFLILTIFFLSFFSKVSAQAPYFPIQPSKFRVVKAFWGNVNTEIEAAPGDKNIPLLVIIQNVGNSTVIGLNMKLILSYPFTNVSGGRIATAFYEGTIQPGLTGTGQFILNIDANATSGEYILPMMIEYFIIVTGVGKTLYIVNTSEVNVPIFISGTRYIRIYSIIVFPRVISSGGNLTLSGTIVNTASTSLYNANISVSSPVLTRSASIFIGQLDSNIPRPFSFSLQVKRGIQNGTFPIIIRVTSQDLTLGVIHTNSITTVIHVQTVEILQKPIEQTKRERNIVIEIILRLLQVFFGFPALEILDSKLLRD